MYVTIKDPFNMIFILQENGSKVKPDTVFNHLTQLILAISELATADQICQQ